MKEIYGGKWSWKRRAIIVIHQDQWIAASMHGMPHGAGVMEVIIMVGVVINLIGAMAFLILAIFLLKGKGAFLIAGYNTMSDTEKAKYDEIALCKFMGKVMYGISFSLLLWALSDLLNIQVLFTIGLVLFLFLIVFVLVYSNTGNRFKRKF